MDNGYDVSLSAGFDPESEEIWESGQDILQNVLEPSSSESEQSLEQSAEESQASTSLEYELGAFTSYDLQTFGTLYAGGICAGFAISIVIALACWSVALAIKIIKEGGQ